MVYKCFYSQNTKDYAAIVVIVGIVVAVTTFILNVCSILPNVILSYSQMTVWVL